MGRLSGQRATSNAVPNTDRCEQVCRCVYFAVAASPPDRATASDSRRVAGAFRPPLRQPGLGASVNTLPLSPRLAAGVMKRW